MTIIKETARRPWVFGIKTVAPEKLMFEITHQSILWKLHHHSLNNKILCESVYYEVTNVQTPAKPFYLSLIIFYMSRSRSFLHILDSCLLHFICFPVGCKQGQSQFIVLSYTDIIQQQRLFQAPKPRTCTLSVTLFAHAFMPQINFLTQ